MKKTNKITESQNPNSKDIDSMEIGEILDVIHTEDSTITDAVSNILPKLELLINDVLNSFRSGGRLLYVGSGTSGRLGVLDAAECPPTYSTNPDMVQGIIAGGSEALVRSIEGAEDNPEEGMSAIESKFVTEIDTVIGISASSTTTFVLGALQKAHSNGAVTGLIICNNPSELNYVKHIIPVITGPEVITGSTRMKAGTASKMILNMITTTAMIKLNKTYGNFMVDLKAVNQKLWDRGTRIISQLTGIDYDAALRILNKADGEVKTAILMVELEINIHQARKLIESHNGSLRKALTNK